MSYSYTFSETTSFTVTHAKHMAAKVATDLKRLQRLYGMPSDNSISDYEAEVIELLKGGYLQQVTYGYKRDGKWIEPTLKYTAHDLARASADDDDPGRIRPGADISGASFASFLTYNQTWFNLALEAKEEIKNKIPVKRSDAVEPGVNGYFHDDRMYSSGGRSLNRSSVKTY